MATAPQVGTLVSTSPAPITPVIRPPTLTAASGPSRSFIKLIPVWITSGFVHVVLLALFMVVNVDTNAQVAETETTVLETKIEESRPPPNLENDNIGEDPEVLSNFNMTRIEDVTVPGPVNPAEAVGLANAPEAAPTNIPAPEGLGAVGQGGGVDSSMPGMGKLTGFAGSLTGIKMLPGGFGGRSGATRERLVKEFGGNKQSEAAVASGLRWFAVHQAPDGHWSLDQFHVYGRCNCTGPGGTKNDVAGTAFGLLPMLGAGYTHQGGEKKSTYAKNVERGLKFLLFQQNRDGQFNPDMYAHGLATIAVCEAYGLTSDPILKGPAQRAINFLAKAQNAKGGWDYTPGGPTPDTSIGGWQIMAIKSAQMSGLDVPQKTLVGAVKWLDEWAGDRDGSIYGYRQAHARQPDEGGASPQSMIAIGLLCREYLGWGPRAPGLIKGAQWLLKPENMPLPANRSHMYFHYYATQVMHHMGGNFWARWNAAMRDWLIRGQDQGNTLAGHPHQQGSWDPKADWWCAYGGRVMMTSVCLLTLEVYYRHLPLYRRDMAGAK